MTPVPSLSPRLFLAGGLFFGWAGVNHLLQQRRGRLENLAMASDLFAAVVLPGACAGVALRL